MGGICDGVHEPNWREEISIEIWVSTNPRRKELRSFALIRIRVSMNFFGAPVCRLRGVVYEALPSAHKSAKRVILPD